MATVDHVVWQQIRDGEIELDIMSQDLSALLWITAHKEAVMYSDTLFTISIQEQFLYARLFLCKCLKLV